MFLKNISINTGKIKQVTTSSDNYVIYIAYVLKSNIVAKNNVRNKNKKKIFCPVFLQNINVASC